METLPIHDAQSRLPELVEKAEAGEMIVLTRDGAAVAQITTTARKAGGIDWAGLEAFKKKHGIDTIFGPIPEDFDDPLPEDFLIRPLPSAL